MTERICRTRGAASVLFVVLLLVAAATSTRANVDASGPWFVVTDPPALTCHLNFAQNGTDLSVTGSCDPFSSRLDLSGTIDSASGVFRVTGSSNFPTVCGSFTFEATVAPDGSSFSGTYTCANSTGGSLPISGSRCGNGVLDAGEQCDDGNRSDFDCCDAGCRFKSPGAPCDFNECRASTCDGAGVCERVNLPGPCDDANPCTAGDACVEGECVGSRLPDGSACDDGNPCTGGDRCSSGFCFGGEPVTCEACSVCEPFQGCVPRPRYGCSGPDTATLLLSDRQGARKDNVLLRWDGGTPVAPGGRRGPLRPSSVEDFGDPRTDTDYAVCAFEGFDDEGLGEEGFSEPRRLLASAVPAGGTCGGKPCWKAMAHGYRYRDPEATPDGIRSLVLRSGKAKAARIKAAGRGANLNLSSLPVHLPLVVQLQASNGQCWQAVYRNPKVNNPVKFKGTVVSRRDDVDQGDE